MKFTRVLASVVAVTAIWGSVATSEQIGVVSSATAVMRATAPGQSSRNISSGAAVVANDKVATSKSVRGQLLFEDQTTLSIAPASQIVLDRFIYDPSGGQGGFGIKLTKGALRFVGGATSELQEATITTPTATLGIRGSTALVSHRGGRTTAIFLMGQQMCITAQGNRICTNRFGGVLTEDGYAGSISADGLKNMIELVDGAPPANLVRSPIRIDLSGSVQPTQMPVTTQGQGTGIGSDTNVDLNFLNDLGASGSSGSEFY